MLTFKQKKRNWHKSNRAFVFKYFSGTCQICQHQIILEKWDIHHFHYNYKGILYDTTSLELIENNVITLVCRSCHNDIHTAKDPENKKILENKASCEICKKIERGIFDRKRQENLDKLLCRNCYLNNKNGIVQCQLF